jgi:hypothetical protein
LAGIRGRVKSVILVGACFAEDMAAADQAHADGQARSAADVFTELDAQDAGR